MRQSLSFRTALIKHALGKKGKTFDRNYDVEELIKINREYQKIADSFSHKIGIRRKWINEEKKDGSRK